MSCLVVPVDKGPLFKVMSNPSKPVIPVCCVCAFDFPGAKTLKILYRASKVAPPSMKFSNISLPFRWRVYNYVFGNHLLCIIKLCLPLFRLFLSSCGAYHDTLFQSTPSFLIPWYLEWTLFYIFLKAKINYVLAKDVQDMASRK